MDKIYNQLLNSAFKRLINRLLRAALPIVLITSYIFSIISVAHAVNPDTSQFVVRPNMGPPTSVTDLVATSTINAQVTLKWSAAAEDTAPWLGTLIPQYPYVVRYSTNPLSAFPLINNTTNWWNQTNTDLPFEGTGKPPYQPESATVDFSISHPELEGQIVYFAIRAKDSGNVLSTDFNISSVTVKSNNITTPDAISDLTALTGYYEGEVKLSWTEPTNIANG